jgi:hypothetical protein
MYSNDQIIFKRFLEYNNIHQIYISNALLHFDRIKDFYQLQNYYNVDGPLLVFGMYNETDFDILNNHNGNMWIMFGGTDVDGRYERRRKNIERLKTYKNVEFISNSSNMLLRLNEYNMKCIYLANDMVNYTMFQPYTKDELKLNNKYIIIYDGNSRSDPKIYSKDICDDLVKTMSNITFYRTSDSSKVVNYSNMRLFYKTASLVLRLTINDGGSETTKECKQLGVPIVHNNSLYGLKWNNIDTIKNIICMRMKYPAININKSIFNTLYIIIRNADSISNDFYDGICLLEQHNINIEVLMENIEVYNKIKYDYPFIKNVQLNGLCLDPKYLITMDSDNVIGNNIQYSQDSSISVKNAIIREILYRREYVPHRFSIIMPFFKKHRYVKRAIASIMKQTYLNYELIIINDDPYDHKLDNYMFDLMGTCDFPITYIKSYKNGGAYNARNIGIMNSNGQYISILDPDDEYTSVKLQNDFNAFQKYNCDVVQSKYVRYVEGTTQLIEDFRDYPNGKFGDTMCSFTRILFTQIGIYDNTRYAGDSEFIARIQYNNIPIIKVNKCNYIAYIENTTNNNLTVSISKDIRNEYVSSFTKMHITNCEMNYIWEYNYSVFTNDHH